MGLSGKNNLPRERKNDKSWISFSTVTETTTPSAPEPTAPASVVADARPAEGPKLIQTGQLNWPIPVLTASGLVLVAVGAYLMERSKKREKNA